MTTEFVGEIPLKFNESLVDISNSTVFLNLFIWFLLKSLNSFILLKAL